MRNRAPLGTRRSRQMKKGTRRHTHCNQSCNRRKGSRLLRPGSSPNSSQKEARRTGKKTAVWWTTCWSQRAVHSPLPHTKPALPWGSGGYLLHRGLGGGRRALYLAFHVRGGQVLVLVDKRRQWRLLSLYSPIYYHRSPFNTGTIIGVLQSYYCNTKTNRRLRSLYDNKHELLCAFWIVAERRSACVAKGR